jgi:hypothetical protein
MATLRTAPVVCAVCVVGSAVALASRTATAQDRPSFDVGVGARHDRFSYHFDNPSSFDTAALVPHFFEQRYVADNVWLVASVHFTAGIRWDMSAGATPARQATGDDYDTFLNPEGTVWVSGTTGSISIHSWQITMRGEVARRGAVSFLVGYRWREDRSDFGLGHNTVTRNGVTVATEDVTDPERTQSRVLEILAGASLSHRIGQRWRLTADGEFAPVTLGRLLVQLPVKYPGEDLVFVAKGMAVSGRMSVAYQRPGWRLEVAGDAGHTGGYGSTATLARDLFGVQFSVGRSF